MEDVFDVKEYIKEIIIKDVCDFFGIELEDVVKSPNNRTRVMSRIYPRQVLEYCLHRIGRISQAATAKITGLKEHSTVLNSVKVVERDIELGPYKSDNISLPDIRPLIEKVKADVVGVCNIQGNTQISNIAILKTAVLKQIERTEEQLNILKETYNNYLQLEKDAEKIKELLPVG